MLQRLFGLAQRGTSVRTEILAGITTFITMACIVVINPVILGDAGMPIAGVAAGGRTGLTSVVVGVLFLATLNIAPLVQAIPAFLTVVITPLSYSITNGLAFGITSYALLKLLGGQARVSDWPILLLAALCGVRFVYLS